MALALVFHVGYLENLGEMRDPMIDNQCVPLIFEIFTEILMCILLQFFGAKVSLMFYRVSFFYAVLNVFL